MSSLMTEETMLNNNSIMDEVTPLAFHLGQNYPNPFSEKTTVKYCVAYKTRVQITVYDYDGKVIEKLVDEEKKPGTYEVEFDAAICHSGLRPKRDGESADGERTLAQGYYYYKMIAGDFTSEKKWLCINKLSEGLNMKTLLQTLFFFLLITQICFAQWYQQNSGTTKNLRDVAFLNAETGIAVGDSGTILRTTNSGTSWTPITNGVTNDFTGMCFVDANKGWAASCNISGFHTESEDSATILHTTDGGTTWINQLTMPLTLLYDVDFIDAYNGWVVGASTDSIWWISSYPILLRTTNGGTSWTEIINDSIYATKVLFLDVNNGWILDNGYWNGRIFLTTDGGNTWALQFETTNAYYAGLKDIVSFDLNNTFAVGIFKQGSIFPTEGLIVKTTDGGASWTQTFVFIPPSGIWRGLNGVFFSNVSNGIVVGDFGVIYQTSDSGISWNSQTSGASYDLNTVCFTDDLNGWVVGDNGTILHTTNGGVSFVEEEEIDEMPTEFLLSNNYPNPFNPSTKIKYSIPPVGTQRAVSVQLKVFDVLGNEIETLVNQEKPAGTYEVTWYAEQLPSGVYFYQLRAGSYIETKKMLLMK